MNWPTERTCLKRISPREVLRSSHKWRGQPINDLIKDLSILDLVHCCTETMSPILSATKTRTNVRKPKNKERSLDEIVAAFSEMFGCRDRMISSKVIAANEFIPEEIVL